MSEVQNGETQPHEPIVQSRVRSRYPKRTFWDCIQENKLAVIIIIIILILIIWWYCVHKKTSIHKSGTKSEF
jgi:hypothetical protein